MVASRFVRATAAVLVSVTVMLAAVSCSSAAVDETPSAEVGPTAAVSSAGESTTSDVAEPLVVEREDWGAVFEEHGVVGTIAVRAVGGDETLVWNAARAAEPRRPASTFKILNSLVILESGVLPDVDTMVPWDGVERSVPAWNQDLSLRTGIEVSAVWMYQEMARRVGADRMLEAIGASGYGNEVLGGPIDEFWLTGELAISPLEQLDFLERLATGDLPFAPGNVDAVADILVRERGEDWTWSHKTGTALIEEPDLGWLVGTTSRADRRWVFALNIDLEVAGDVVGQIDPLVRQEVARRILQDVGALPA